MPVLFDPVSKIKKSRRNKGFLFCCVKAAYDTEIPRSTLKQGGASTCKCLAFQNVTFLHIQYTHFISLSFDVKWLWLDVSPGHSEMKHFSVAWRHTRDPALQSQPELYHMPPFVKVTLVQSKMLHTSFKSGQTRKDGWMC